MARPFLGGTSAGVVSVDAAKTMAKSDTGKTFMVTDTGSAGYAITLPTPANALLILSLPLIIQFQNTQFITTLILNPWFLIGLTFVSCYLLNAKVKLFALKFKDYSFKNNTIRYVLIISTIVLLVLLQFAAIPLIILLYIGLSVFENIRSKSLSKSL